MHNMGNSFNSLVTNWAKSASPNNFTCPVLYIYIYRLSLFSNVVKQLTYNGFWERSKLIISRVSSRVVYVVYHSKESKLFITRLIDVFTHVHCPKFHIYYAFDQLRTSYQNIGINTEPIRYTSYCLEKSCTP